MATSKIKVIEKTLKKAIDYIINPDKTDGGQLVYSHACSVATADIEMELTAKQGTGRGNRVAYHLIQSFSPEDDISPEKALELGIEFAREVTGGSNEFVIATHIDKEHVHNHIIFNSVDYVSHRKYHSDKKDKYRIRDINDEICKENNLSVLPKYTAKRKTKYENIHKDAEAGWKNKLKNAIDDAIQSAASFEDFLYTMEMEGFDIKRGKHIAFHVPGQERKGRAAYTRAKSIGDDYTEDAIRSRIENKGKENITKKTYSNEKTVKKNMRHNEQTVKTQNNENSGKKQFYKKRINLLVDISKNVKAQQSKGYEQALVRSNINTLNKTMNYLIEHNITTSEEFAVFADGVRAEYKLNMRSVKKIDKELLDLSQKIKFTQNYKKYRQIFLMSQRSKQNPEFYQEHKDELVLYNASRIFFEQNQINPNDMNLSELFNHYKELKEERFELIKNNNPLKKKLRELEIIEKNITDALEIDMNNKEESSLDEENEKHNKRDQRER